MKNKKMIVSLLLVMGLISITMGVTFSFFNYTSTGNDNILAVGKINFTSSQGTSINLTNVFPVKRSEMENSSSVGEVILTITGDTTYDDGIEYLVSADSVVNTVGSKEIPLGVVVTANNLGTSDDSYFQNRGGNTSLYKVITKDTIKEDGELLVGYIAKGSTGVNGTVTVKAFIDAEKIAISDTYDGTESGSMGTTNEWVNDRTVLTTTEWNSLNSNGVSFKLKVEANEGIWVKEPLTALSQIRKNVIIPATPINFANASSEGNGQGLYVLKGTENDTYPIYYYRGAIDNNNVVFAGYCWQIVRTTDTGGVKMIYNGLPDVSGSGSNITYNCGTTRDIQDTILSITDLKQSTGYFYADDYEIVSTSGNSVTYRLKAGSNPITQVAIANATSAAAAIPTIATNYPYTCKSTSSTGTCTSLYKVDSYASSTNANVYSALDRPIIGRSVFNTNDNSVSDVGYMSNTRYEYTFGLSASNSIYGKNVEWDGTNYLVIEDTVGTASTNTTLDANHHYTCGTASATTCTSVRYYYYENFYITLINGDTKEDALYKMTGNGSTETKTKNSGYNINVNDSTAKTVIDNWFKANLTNEIDNTKTDYRVYLEDTVFCNDRSYKTIGINNTYPYAQSGWNPNGGSLVKELAFGTWNRYSNSWYSTSNVPAVKNTGEVPNIACSNEIDRFTVLNTNGNGALTYPVGLLTADEIILAAIGGNKVGVSYFYYLYTNDYYWSMSPDLFFQETSRVFSALVFLASDYRYLVEDHVDYTYGLRPVVSLRLGTEFVEGGDGTGTNPYVVKYN